MAPFRLFGRPSAAPHPGPWGDVPADGWAGPPPAPECRAEPPTDPYGFPALVPPPAGAAGWPSTPPAGWPPPGPARAGWSAPEAAGSRWGPQAWAGSGAHRPSGPDPAHRPPEPGPAHRPPEPGPARRSPAEDFGPVSPTPPRLDPAEAGAMAGAFAVDYLSWDEDDPGRRGRVLRDYLRPPVADAALLGWSGHGRQRGEFALPGLVRRDGNGRVLVDVRVRVTPYRAVGERVAERVAGTGAGTGTGIAPEPEPGVAGVPAVAPAPTGRGWRSLASCWVRLSVPVTCEGGRLVVDAWEETLAEHAAPGPAVAPDEPLAGGAS